MRISDWSSDVCSSDLIWVKAMNRIHHRILAKLEVDRVILAEQEMGQHIAQMLHNQLVRDYVSLGNGFHVVDFRVPEPLEGAAIGKLKQIGRASCRERVWRYMSISVVAVSLKKK